MAAPAVLLSLILKSFNFIKMENIITKSILWVMLTMPFSALAHSNVINHSSTGELLVLPTLVAEYGLSDISDIQELKLCSKPAPSVRSSESDNYFHAVLSENGTLASELGDRKLEIDSISVEGPINEDDFNTLWESSFNGRLRIVNLEKAVIEGGKIPEYAFFHKDVQIDWDTWIITTTPLEKVILPDDVTEIGKGAFAYSINLVEINFPRALRYIGTSAFTDCIRLPSEQLAFPEGLEKIDEQAFYQCRSLDGKITLPSSLTWIDSAVFYNCAISDINIPENLEYLSCMTFAGSRFKKAILPDDCYLCPHGGQFYNNWELTEAHLPDNMEFVPMDIFTGCMQLAAVNIPSKARSIEEFAFDGTKITDIYFPETLESIGQDAFQGCYGLTTLLLPSSLKDLGDRSFALCSNLKSIYCKATVPPAYLQVSGYESDGTPFSSVDTSIPVYIPVGTKQRYMAAAGWNSMTNFIETDNFPSSGIDGVKTEDKWQDDSIYDLSGRKVNTPQPGTINIQSGKKILINR